MTSRGFVIVVRNNSFIRQLIAFFRAYLVTILKALIKKGNLSSIPIFTLGHKTYLTQAGAYPQLPTQPNFFFDHFQTYTAI